MRFNTLKTLQLSLCLLTVSVSSLAMADNMPANIRWDKHQVVEFAPKAAAEIPAKQANLVFFRNEDGKAEQTAVNIGINDRYQASLRGGAYTEILSCAFKTVVSTEVTGRKINNLQEDGLPYRFEEGKNYYFEVVVDEQGVAKANSVSEAVALAQLKGKPLQAHTISRVVEPNCLQEPAPVVPEPPAEKQVLEDIYLFDFDVRTLSVFEQNRAKEFAQKVSAANIDNYKLYISGYADPMGVSTYNQKLSDDRAVAVRNAYISYGLPAERMVMDSFGDTRPVVESCNSIANRTQRNECNHRNRRVTVQVTEQ